MYPRNFWLGTLLVILAAPGRAESVRERLVIWEDRGDMASRDLYHGSGGKGRVPQGPFTFVKEDDGGSTPKFVVRDRSGAEWRVKLGPEARSETAATRLIWAAGFFTDDDYLVPVLRVRHLPRLRRGQSKVGPDGSIHNARLERSPQGAKFEGSWKWKENPFTGTREMNALLVVMAMINNWDLKDSNTTLYRAGNPASPKVIYAVGDVGATFGRPSYQIPSGKSNVKAYARSKFVTRVKDDSVNFRSPAHAPMASVFVIPHLFSTIRWMQHKSLGRDIPKQDARWIGEILSRLSERQVRSAFESAGYSPAEVSTFSEVVLSRIAQLTEL